MKRTGKWAVGILLTVAAAVTALQAVFTPDPERETPTAQSVIVSVETESLIPQTESPTVQNQACGYQWAYKNAPELTTLFDGAVKDLNLDASGRVEYYGEDCVHADGTSTFGAMETDFHVRLKVTDLKQEEEFGNWIAQVMQIVTEIPREKLSGNYGFVEFWFEKNETEHIVFRVPIQQYLNEAPGKSGAELFKMYYSPP